MDKDILLNLIVPNIELYRLSQLFDAIKRNINLKEMPISKEYILKNSGTLIGISDMMRVFFTEYMFIDNLVDRMFKDSLTGYVNKGGTRFEKILKTLCMDIINYYKSPDPLMLNKKMLNKNYIKNAKNLLMQLKLITYHLGELASSIIMLTKVTKELDQEKGNVQLLFYVMIDHYDKILKYVADLRTTMCKFNIFYLCHKLSNVKINEVLINLYRTRNIQDITLSIKDINVNNKLIFTNINRVYSEEDMMVWLNIICIIGTELKFGKYIEDNYEHNADYVNACRSSQINQIK